MIIKFNTEGKKKPHAPGYLMKTLKIGRESTEAHENGVSDPSYAFTYIFVNRAGSMFQW